MRQAQLILGEHLGSLSVFGGLLFAHSFNFLSHAFYFVCLRFSICMYNIAYVSGMSIIIIVSFVFL